MATMWSRKCMSCGYSVSGRSTSYNGTTIGPALTKCPQCGHIQGIKTHREWVQLSTVTKMACAMNQSALSLLIVMLMGFAGIYVTSVYLTVPVIVRVLAFVLGFVLGIFIAYFIQIRRKKFIDAYAYSLRRTDNEKYRQMLNLPSPTDKMMAIPLYSPNQHQQKHIEVIRSTVIEEPEFYSSFNEI